MTTVTVDNLNESLELDRKAAAELRGGFYPAYIGTFLASFSFTEVTQNAVSINIISGAQGINSIGSISAMPVSAGSPMTVVQGALV